MRNVKKRHMAWLVFWVFLTYVCIAMMPNVDQLVREKGQIAVPEEAQSMVAKDLQNRMSGNDADTFQAVAVFHSGSEKKLTDRQNTEIEQMLKNLESQQERLGIEALTTHLDSEAQMDRFVSEDGTTILAQLSIQKGDRKVYEIAEEIDKELQSEAVDTYLTGNQLVMEDFSRSTQDGIQKTEIIAVVFIILVLILVFRSPIVPLVSLLSVGVSYLISLGIVTMLVEQWSFPFSNFTQVFLVVILFGIGTDYNILLFTRYKKELMKENAVPYQAMRTTYQTAGKTVVYSALAVFIGFVILYFARFSLYQVGSAIAIGVLVLVLVLFTLNPFFMLLLGKKMFWPIQKLNGHEENRIWAFLAEQASKRPVLGLFCVAVVCIPSMILFDNVQSFNDLLEVDDHYESKQGVKIIEAHYPPGFSAPAVLMLQSDESFNQPEMLQKMDELAEKISKIEGVSQVLSVTRPTGEKIEALYLSDQAQTLNHGLGEANQGIESISRGLSDAQAQLSKNQSGNPKDLQKLVDGTESIQQGVQKLDEAVKALSVGITSGATGADAFHQGLKEISVNINTLSQAIKSLYNGYVEIETGFQTFGKYLSDMKTAVDTAQAGYEQIAVLLGMAVENVPDLQQNPHVMQSIQIAKGGQQQLTALSMQMENLLAEYQGGLGAFQQANASFIQVRTGFSNLQNGVAALEAGAMRLSNGLHDAADAVNEMNVQTPQLVSGMNELQNGQQRLVHDLSDLSHKISQLQSGLSEGSDGLQEIQTGLSDAQTYLTELSGSGTEKQFYIPEDVRNGEAFQKALDVYMSDDGQITQMNMILAVNPYTREAMEIIQEIRKETAAFIASNQLENIVAGVGGKSAENVDLEKISQSDFIRTAALMLFGIFIILVVVTHSIEKSIFILLSLILAYGVSLSLSAWIAVHVLDVPALGWNVPFFSFIMIVALGVDYSIFLMMRYKEAGGYTTTAFVDAAKHIGGVVLSAALILGGTFAALIPSGVMTLIEVAMAVIIALCLLAFLMLPVFLPASFAFLDRVKRWVEQRV